MPDRRRRLASDLGCTLDCDLATGRTGAGAPATDDTALLNAFLATASATSPITLVLDGAALVTGLVLNGGHTTIEGIGPDSGLYLQSGSNSHAIRNYLPMQGDPGGGHVAPPRLNSGVALRNFRLNANRGDGHTGNSSRGFTYDISGLVMLYGISLLHTTGVWLEDLIVHDATTYAISLSNCAGIVCRNLRVEAPSNDRNTDGLHLDGPASDIQISNCYFQTGDDAIAFNAPEGFGGAITRAAISNCVFDRAATAIRMYGTNDAGRPFSVSDVVMSNCTGEVTNTPFMLGFEQRSVPDTTETFSAGNCSFHAHHWATLNESCGVLTFENNTWDSPTAAGYFLWIPRPVTLSSVTVANCRIYRSTRGNAPAFGLHAAELARGSVIRKLAFDGFAIEHEAGQGSRPFPFCSTPRTSRSNSSLSARSTPPTSPPSSNRHSTSAASAPSAAPASSPPASRFPTASWPTTPPSSARTPANPASSSTAESENSSRLDPPGDRSARERLIGRTTRRRKAASIRRQPEVHRPAPQPGSIYHLSGIPAPPMHPYSR